MRNAGFWGGIVVSLIILILFNVLPSKDHHQHDVTATGHDDHGHHEANAHIVEEAEETVEPEMAESNEESNEMERLRTGFAEGSWEWQLLDFIESDEPEISFVLEKVPFEGEELPSEGGLELDHLAEIQTAFPFLNIDIQAHSTAAKNKVGRTAKRATCKARALWVMAKLRTRGVNKENISASGMADDALIPGLPTDDKAHRRITAVITRGASF